ncbi:polysaccharide lyase 6 family protein [Labilibacter marinus]|uniref:polysaccharide lyase 6 family protein n=1 Tax=Labilibacter marinus TaxID=1477105 RepID=UPI00082E3CBC|nr:polysaccharide lyase 6 family protein [Labilibacter marinus]
MRYFNTYILIVVGCLVFSLSNATNYSVSSAFDIENVLNDIQPGDTIKMTSGNWVNENIVFEGQGTETNPIVLIPAFKNKVILSGTSSLRVAGSYLEVNGLQFVDGYSTSGAVIEFRNGSSKLANNCRLTNTSIVDYNPTDKDEDYKWVSVYGKNNRIDHCEFSGKQHSGTTLVVWLNDEPNYTQIDYNYFGARPDLGYNGGETIRIGTSSNSMKESRAIVEYNLFEECDGEIEIISNKSCFNTYRYNTFNNCDGCLTLRHGNDCSVYSNFFLGDNKSSGGVRVIGERHQVYNNYFDGLKGDGYRSAICIMNGVPNSPLNRYFQVKDAVIVNNTMVNCKVPLTVGAGKDSEKSLAPLDCTFANNVMDKTSGSQNVEFDDQPTNMTWLGNVMNAEADDEEVSEGFVFADPQLALVEGLYRPAASSIVINASQGSFPQIQSDIDGQEREGDKDAGCDELSDAPIINKPLDKSEVGPYFGQDDDVSVVNTRAALQADMVKCYIKNNVISVLVQETKFLPLQYQLFDLTGKALNAGEILSLKTQINTNGTNRILLAHFKSGQKYYQSYKLLQNSSE